MANEEIIGGNQAENIETIGGLIKQLNNRVTGLEQNLPHSTLTTTVSLDGTADFDNLQEALDFVNEEGGGAIKLKDDNYPIAANITFYSNIALIGEGENTVLDFGEAQFGVLVNGLTNVLFSDLAIKDSKGVPLTGGGTDRCMVHVDGNSDDINFERVTFIGVLLHTPITYGVGIGNGGTAGTIRMKDCILLTGGGLIRSVSAESVYVDGANISGNSDDPIKIFATKIGSVTGCTITVGSSSDAITILSSRALVYGNTVAAFRGSGININADYSHVTDNIVENLQNIAEEHLIKVSGDRNIIANNTVILKAATTDIQVGIRVSGNANIIADNEVEGNSSLATYGISILGTGNIVSGNETSNVITTVSDGGTSSIIDYKVGIERRFIADSYRFTTSTGDYRVVGILESATAGRAVHHSASTNRVYAFTSSQKFKEDIKDLEIDSKLIYKLVERSFTPKKIKGEAESPERTFGLIAEEVEKVMPELVCHDEDGKPNAVRYELLAILQNQEMKKLREEIDALKKKVK